LDKLWDQNVFHFDFAIAINASSLSSPAL
jgi:hypothetical protein